MIVVAALMFAAAASPRVAKDGGTFRIAMAIGRVDAIDPALPGIPIVQRLLAPACATLVAHPNKPAPAGYRLAPSLAEAMPVVSNNGRTYTLTVRKDARFSDGSHVTARAFVHALERIFTPGMHSDLASAFENVVGAHKMLAGKITALPGVVARGRTLTLRLTKWTPDLLESLTGLCAVPPSLRADPEGANAPLSSPAPYYVSEYIPGKRLVMERNRFYRGERPHHVDRFVADLASDFGPGIDEVASGTTDTFFPNPTPDQVVELTRRYGVNKSQFFLAPGTSVRVFLLNNRSLFHNNVKLRQAVNFAVDRRALVREAGPHGETATDQYLPTTMRGYRDGHIYPLAGPDLTTARKLAKGHTRSGKAVLYTLDFPSEVSRAQIVKQNLAKIGLDVDIKTFPVPNSYLETVFTPGEPFDLARLQVGVSNPAALRAIFAPPLTEAMPAKYNRLFDHALRLTGDERDRALGDLDVQVSRDFAPMIPVAVVNWPTFVSARVGCIVLTPSLDLTAVCLK